MSILVLTYHSCNITGTSYSENDHIALEDDLAVIHELGYELVSLDEAVRAGLSGENKSLIALTFDDGPIFDFRDFEHPTCGFQKSFQRILVEFSECTGVRAYGASFVIASPAGREQMDVKHYGHRGWWKDDWWRGANTDGILSIQSHSWDHNHIAIDPSVQKDNQRGEFCNIDTFQECESELAQASAYIDAISGKTPEFFAYPWGHASDYLRYEYLPNRGSQLGLKAAFGTQAKPINQQSERWFLPRFVCGEHWHSSEGLVQILRKLK